MALPNYTYTPPPIIGGATTARRPGFASQETLPLQGGVYDRSGFFGDIGRSFQIGALQGKEMVSSISMGIGIMLDSTDRVRKNQSAPNPATPSSGAPPERKRLSAHSPAMNSDNINAPDMMTSKFSALR